MIRIISLRSFTFFHVHKNQKIIYSLVKKKVNERQPQSLEEN